MSALLLNATEERLRIISFRRALTLVLTDRAVMVRASGEEWRTTTTAYPVPAVVKLKHMVKIPFASAVPLNRRTLAVRDNGVCQVAGCDKRGNTIDHVTPRSRGGKHDWRNTVLMCAGHNQRKGDRLLEELGWRLKQQPRTPRGAVMLLAQAKAPVQEQWKPYLGLEPVV